MTIRPSWTWRGRDAETEGRVARSIMLIAGPDVTVEQLGRLLAGRWRVYR